jgi:methyl-accepting chemotaxis protein
MNLFKFFKNLKIYYKIMLSFCVISLIMLLVGIIGFYFNEKSNNEINRLYDDILVPSNQISTLKTYNTYAKSLIYKIIIEDDLSTKKEIDKKLKDIRKNTNELFAKFRERNLDQKEKELIKNIDDSVVGWRDVRAKATKRALNNENKYELLEYFADKGDTLEIALEAYDKMISYHQSKAQKLKEDNEKSHHLSTIIIIGMNIAGILAGILLGMSLSKSMSNTINSVAKNLNEVAEGNLTINKIENDSKDETGKLAHALNITVDNLKKLIGAVAKSSEDISASSEQMSASADQTAQGSQQTASSTAQLAQGSQEISNNVDQGAAIINKMNKQIQMISNEAVEAANIGNDTEIIASEGTGHVQKAVGKIDRIKVVSEDISVTIANLGTLSKSIEAIVDLIKSIASQTNLLALNAAIEAARAGEHGKGFAVVAEEVKKLAGKSAEATDKISEMIKEIQKETFVAVNKMNTAANEVEEGVTVVNETGAVLENIISQVQLTNSKIQHITREIEEVANNSDDVVKMIENISAITEQTAASAEEISSIAEQQTASMEEISANSQTLAKIAEELNSHVSVFKI